jgi:hypothetical protein
MFVLIMDEQLQGLIPLLPNAEFEIFTAVTTKIGK